jgi:hypothetical protein
MRRQFPSLLLCNNIEAASKAVGKFNDSLSSWPTEPSAKTGDAAEVSTKLGLTLSVIVNAVVTAASEPPNLGPFNDVEHKLFPASRFQKGFLRSMQELLDDLKKETEAKKVARKAEREKEKLKKSVERAAPSYAVNQAIASAQMGSAPVVQFPSRALKSPHAAAPLPLVRPSGGG